MKLGDRAADNYEPRDSFLDYDESEAIPELIENLRKLREDMKDKAEGVVHCQHDLREAEADFQEAKRLFEDQITELENLGVPADEAMREARNE